MAWQQMTAKQREEYKKIKDSSLPSGRLAKIARQVANNPPPKGFKK